MSIDPQLVINPHDYQSPHVADTPPELPSDYIPLKDRKTILLLADDIRFPSGVGTMAKEIVFGSAHRFSWIQIGAGVNHPEVGRVTDMSEAVGQSMGIPDARVKIYPYNGYGDPNLVRHLIKSESIDMIVHFTDPRYWIWLYHMEREIRAKIPICYYSIWDDLPYPKYNRDFYRSSDAIFPISKQTHNIVKQVLGEDNVEVIDWKAIESEKETSHNV